MLTIRQKILAKVRRRVKTPLSKFRLVYDSAQLGAKYIASTIDESGQPQLVMVDINAETWDDHQVVERHEFIEFSVSILKRPV